MPPFLWNSSPPIFPLVPTFPHSFSPLFQIPAKTHHFPFLIFSKKNPSLSLSASFSSFQEQIAAADEEEHVVGDCLVFEEGIFEDPYLQQDFEGEPEIPQKPSKKKPMEISSESLVPDEWREAQAELNMTKKEKRLLAREVQFGSRVQKKKIVALPDQKEYLTYREMKLSQLKPVVLDNAKYSKMAEERVSESHSDEEEEEFGCSSSGRLLPRNPRLGLVYRGLEDVGEMFRSGDYEPGEGGSVKTQGPRKLFTKEEKILLNKRIPSLADATTSKWMPLHTLAASGEFYLVDMLLKHNVDINATDKVGLTALHKAILGKKQAITNYLLRNSANPFVRDNDGATLIHYAVQVASSQAIKILLLYDVDINLSDDDGWTPLHLAVQTQRTDIVRLLLIKGADQTLKNRDGLTPLDLCLYMGQDMRTYELIKLLKELPKSR